MLFVSVIVPELFSILAPPPSIAPLFVNLFLVNDIAPELELMSAPPPEPLPPAELSVNVLDVNVMLDLEVEIKAPPPSLLAELILKLQFSITTRAEEV